MNKRTRRTEISLQLNEVITIRAQRAWLTLCPACRKLVRMIAAEDAALAANYDAREIYRLVEAGRLHFREDENGLLYICLESLQRLVGKNGEQLSIQSS